MGYNRRKATVRSINHGKHVINNDALSQDDDLLPCHSFSVDAIIAINLWSTVSLHAAAAMRESMKLEKLTLERVQMISSGCLVSVQSG